MKSMRFTHSDLHKELCPGAGGVGGSGLREPQDGGERKVTGGGAAGWERDLPS